MNPIVADPFYLFRRLIAAVARLFALWRGRRRILPAAGLPGWAQVRRRRRAHIRRVAELMEAWAAEIDVGPRERRRWLAAVWLHDALRDARLPDGTSHGAAAADRAAQEGETDRGVLDAVRFHSVGYAGWDDVGRMLYLADYLEPGRKGRRKERARLAKRVPRQREAVLREIVARQIEEQLAAGRPIDPLTLAFWNSLAPG
jgi:HD superfamily phosphohydrolase YqeK